jgi:NAD(P)-dependent dehydrogenase (short-subunit alcohol dehydrogenase family)
MNHQEATDAYAKAFREIGWNVAVYPNGQDGQTVLEAFRARVDDAGRSREDVIELWEDGDVVFYAYDMAASSAVHAAREDIGFVLCPATLDAARWAFAWFEEHREAGVDDA